MGALQVVTILVPSENLVRPVIIEESGGLGQPDSGMTPSLLSALAALRSLFRSWAALQAEVFALRHQLLVLERQLAGRRVQLRSSDRLLWAWLSKLWPGWRQALVLVQPETVLRWHRQGFRLYWRWKSRPKRLGRTPITAEVRELILEMHRANPTWGAPRIHGELLKLGFTLAQSTVSKYLPRHRKTPSQGWRTFLRNHLPETVAIDFAVVLTVSFRLLFVFVVLSLERRKLLHVNMTAHPTAQWTAQQMVEAFPWVTTARYVIRDRDRIYGADFRRRVEGLGLHEVPIAPRSPCQNAYAERFIGSLRRECLNHVIVLNERHLRQILSDYRRYYNRSRTHLALEKDAPEPRTAQERQLGEVVAFPEVGGLHHRYERRAA
jgi:transposase InsO family protein